MESLHERVFQLFEQGLRPSEIARLLYPDYSERPRAATVRVSRLLCYCKVKANCNTSECNTDGEVDHRDFVELRAERGYYERAAPFKIKGFSKYDKINALSLEERYFIEALQFNRTLYEIHFLGFDSREVLWEAFYRCLRHLWRYVKGRIHHKRGYLKLDDDVHAAILTAWFYVLYSCWNLHQLMAVKRIISSLKEINPKNPLLSSFLSRLADLL